MNFIHSLALQLKNSLRDLLPVVLVMSFFQTQVGLRNLSNPRTAVRGNAIAAAGMLVAVVATLVANRVVDYATVAFFEF